MSQHMLGNIRGVCHESLGFIERTSSLFTSMPPTSAAEGTPEIINPFTALHGCLCCREEFGVEREHESKPGANFFVNRISLRSSFESKNAGNCSHPDSP